MVRENWAFARCCCSINNRYRKITARPMRCKGQKSRNLTILPRLSCLTLANAESRRRNFFQRVTWLPGQAVLSHCFLPRSRLRAARRRYLGPVPGGVHSIRGWVLSGRHMTRAGWLSGSPSTMEGRACASQGRLTPMALPQRRRGRWSAAAVTRLSRVAK